MSRPATFDPLYDLDGAWTTTLAERYLPLPELAGATYECDDGRLVVTPTQGAATSFGAVELARVLSLPARAAGFVVYGRLNVAFNPDTWIEPDVTVLQCSAADQIWTAASRCTMPVEIVSHLARGHRDRIDRPAMCAAARVPYYLRVYLNSELGHAEVTLLRVDAHHRDYVVIAHGLAGQVFTADEPFEISFDPADLLEPKGAEYDC